MEVPNESLGIERLMQIPCGNSGTVFTFIVFLISCPFYRRNLRKDTDGCFVIHSLDKDATSQKRRKKEKKHRWATLSNKINQALNF